MTWRTSLSGSIIVNWTFKIKYIQRENYVQRNVTVEQNSNKFSKHSKLAVHGSVKFFFETRIFRLEVILN